MKCRREQFASDGYLLVENVLSSEELGKLEINLAGMAGVKAGTRNLLSNQWCTQLGQRIRKHFASYGILPPNSAVVQCTYFHKTEEANWLVASHRDKTIAVSKRIESPHWNNWSIKEGVQYVHPPRGVLEELVAVRVHLESNTKHNGPLRIVPGSHTPAELERPEIECIIGEGGAVAMRPLVLHASSKLLRGSRRVLHYLIGPRTLPNGAEWANAI